MKKLLAVVVIVLFLGLAIAPSTGNIVSFDDDTTPPVTTCTLDPGTPDGDNGWYASDVNVTLNATDDMSGVKEINYKIGSGSWYTITGDNGTFVVDIDDDDLPIEFYAVDNAGNEETHQIVTIDMDQTEPDIEEVLWEPFKEGDDWYYLITCDATDMTSGMDRVEMFIDDEHYETIEGSGPIYEFNIETSKCDYATLWFYHYDNAGNMFKDDIDGGPWYTEAWFIGFIRNPQIINQSLSYFAYIVYGVVPHGCGGHGYPVGIILHHHTLPEGYTGYVGKHFMSVHYEYW